MSAVREKHNHYHKNVKHLDYVDVYRVLDLYGVTDQALGHAIKKLLVAGGRGAGKDFRKDVQEAVDTLTRKLEMMNEDDVAQNQHLVKKPEGPDNEKFGTFDLGK